jgi:hypothetical protein
MLIRKTPHSMKRVFLSLFFCEASYAAAFGAATGRFSFILNPIDLQWFHRTASWLFSLSGRLVALCT